MKSVLISIRPQWVEKIASGEKTIEVRRTRPKLEVPFKAYIYCTKPKKWFRFSSWGYASDECLWLSNGKIKMCDGFEFWADGKDYQCVNGKVIGEFICDKVERLEEHIEQGGLYYTLSYTFNEQAQLDNWELHDYGKGKTLYAWHISDLKIYDKPRELSEFRKPCKVSCENCKNPLYFECWCEEKGKKIVTRPPQSWCYVEDLGEEK